jgi:hypothetical protein
MRACRSNTAEDARMAKSVIEKCEGTFLARLSPEGGARYQQRRKVCEHKYPNMVDLKHVSFRATCEAAVEVEYARRFGLRTRD